MDLTNYQVYKKYIILPTTLRLKTLASCLVNCKYSVWKKDGGVVSLAS